MIFRLVKEKDLAEIKELIEMFFEETISSYGIKKSTTLDDDINACYNNELVQTYIAEKNNKCVGVISFVISKIPFLDGVSAHELMWYVHPDHRRCGIKLLDYSERKLKEKSVETIRMIHFFNDKHIGKMYNKLGYKELEVSYTKKI